MSQWVFCNLLISASYQQKSTFLLLKILTILQPWKAQTKVLAGIRKNTTRTFFPSRTILYTVCRIKKNYSGHIIWHRYTSWLNFSRLQFISVRYNISLPTSEWNYRIYTIHTNRLTLFTETSTINCGYHRNHKQKMPDKMQLYV